MSATENAAAKIAETHRRLNEPAVNPSEPVSGNGAACSEPGCGTRRTLEPDYSPIQPIMGGALGWYSGDGEFCPKHIAKLMALSNRTSYAYFLADGQMIGRTS